MYFSQTLPAYISATDYQRAGNVYIMLGHLSLKLISVNLQKSWFIIRVRISKDLFWYL